MSLTKSLIAHYKLDGNAKDSTPYCNHGTITGAVATTDRHGKTAGALFFENRSYADLGRDKINALLSGAPAISFACWVRPSTLSAVRDHWIFSEYVNSTSVGILGSVNRSYLFGLSGRSRGADIIRSLEGTTTVQINTWYHVVFINDYQNGMQYIYVNGSLDNSGSAAWTLTAYTPTGAALNAYIGDHPSTANRDYFGSIDDARIYNRALSTAEIKSLYDSYQPQLKLHDKGLVAHYTLDGHAKDRTPNNNHGTITGAVATTDRHGKTGGALSFDGVDDKIDLPTALENISTSTTLTWSLWVKHNTATPGDDRYISIYRTAANSAYILRSGTTHKYEFAYTSGSGTTLTYLEGSSVSTNWTHVVGVRDGANVYIYLNGTLSNSASNAVNPTVSSPVNATIGYVSLGLNAQWLNGSIDDVRIYNRALSATEVKSLYDSYQPQIHFLDKGLVAHYTLDGHAKDRTPNSNHGTITGATATTDRHGKTAGALDFDGTDDFIDCGNIVSSVSAFTVSLWIKYTQVGPVGILYKVYTPATYSYIIVADSLATHPSFYVRTASGITTSSRVGSINDGNWHLITGVYDRSLASQRVKLYRDGVLNSSATGYDEDVLIDTGAVRIGRSATIYLDGSIDDVRIYNRALSATEVKRLYESYNPLLKL